MARPGSFSIWPVSRSIWTRRSSWAAPEAAIAAPSSRVRIPIPSRSIRFLPGLALPINDGGEGGMSRNRNCRLFPDERVGEGQLRTALVDRRLARRELEAVGVGVVGEDHP